MENSNAHETPPNTACTRRVGVCGIFKAFFWLRVYTALRANPRSAHTRVTQTVGRLNPYFAQLRREQLMSVDLISMYRALHPHILIAHMRWKQYLILFSVSDERMQLLADSARGFFRIIQDVLRDNAFISLSRLTDKSLTAGKENLSFFALVEAAEMSGNIALATSAKSILNQLLERVESIRAWRNQWLAHLDLTEALASTPLPSHKVKRGDVDKALELTRQFMDLFADHLNQPRHDYQSFIIPGDAEALVKILEEE
jgi:hypothetical protein